MAETNEQWLVGRLRALLDDDPNRLLYTELAGGEQETGQLTATDLAARAAGVVGHLAGMGAKPGDRAILFDVNALDTLGAFFGCMAAGVAPIVLPLPRRPEHVEARLAPVARDSQPVVMLVTPPGNERDQAVLDGIDTGGAPVVAIGDIPIGDPASLPEVPLHDRAFLQYTSGSTALPRGVMIDHHHLMANLEMARKRFMWSEESVVVSWNPLSHDMGLILGALPAVAYRTPVVIMPPEAFVLRPLRWLAAVSKYRATNSNAPNFAYDLCIARIKPADQEALDLSSWRVALNGAEPVREATRRRFLEKFVPNGFRPEAWCPAYGLAEATVFVSSSLSTETSGSVWVDRKELGHGRVVEAPADAAGSTEVVACGRPAAGLELAVVDPDTRVRLGPDGVGELWVRGPSVTSGYFNWPEDEPSPFAAVIEGEGEGGFLRTGDIAFLIDGEVYIVGRAKDVIIVHGRNVHAVDIELAVKGCHPAVRPGGIAAFANPTPDGDKTVVVVEVDGTPDAAEVAKVIRERVFAAVEVPVDDVVLTAPRGVPKTTSGKVQRAECRNQYLSGALPPPEERTPAPA